MSQPSPIRLAVLDADTGFLQVLSKRLEGAGWQYRVLASPVPLDAIVAMRLNAIVLDFSGVDVLGTADLDRIHAFLGTARLLGSRTAISSLAPGIAAFLATTDARTDGIDFFLGLEDALRRYSDSRA